MLGARGHWVALAVAAASVVLPTEAAHAVDPACPFTPQSVSGTVHTWDGSTSSSWGIAANWDTNQVPNDNTTGNGTPELTTTYVCIPPDSTVVLDDQDLSDFSSNQVDVQAFWLGPRATMEIHPGVGLFTMSHTTASVVEQGSHLNVTSGYLGGEGAVRVHGDVTVVASGTTGASTLQTTPSSMPENLQTQAGTLVVEPAGRLVVPSLGVAMARRYGVAVLGRLLVNGTGFLAADYGTSLSIGSGGVFEIANDGGYYQGFSSATLPLATLVNAGTLLKSGGTGTSIVDADYSEVGGGHAAVQSGTLALPTGNVNAAPVASGHTLSTGKCENRNAHDPCVLTTDPAQDEQSVSFTVPTSDANGAGVLVHEDATRVFTAHATDLQATVGDPALIELRMVARSPGETPDGLDVVHVDARGVEVVLPPCPAVGLPGVATNCVDRSSSHAGGGNVFMNVRTVQTSRYICRREDTVPPVFMGAPSAPRVKLGKPIGVTAAINEAGSIAVSGTIRTKRVKVRGLTLTGLSRPEPGEPGRVVLRLKRHQKLKLRQSGATKGSIKLTITATDLHGNVTTTRVRVPLS